MEYAFGSNIRVSGWFSTLSQVVRNAVRNLLDDIAAVFILVTDALHQAAQHLKANDSGPTAFQFSLRQLAAAWETNSSGETSAESEVWRRKRRSLHIKTVSRRRRQMKKFMLSVIRC